MKKYLYLFLILTAVASFWSCNSDELDPVSIYEDPSTQWDPNSYSYLLDRWLYDNYLKTYNLVFLYKLQDVGADMNYNLVPTEYEKAIDMAVLVKYLWFDVYKDEVRPDFLKEYGPRIIHLIGSPAYNPANGTMILGLAEGGLKVSLFRCNSLDIADIEKMNEYYFKTMHHEFAHIMHQTKAYPKDFNLLSAGYYSPFGWQDRDWRVAASLGFISDYAGCETQEDFVEIIANYIVKSQKQWDEVLDAATKGWEPVLDADGNSVMEIDIYGRQIKTYKEAPDTDGIDGKALIEQKLAICKQWLKDAWGIELDALKQDVQDRQQHIDLNSLRNQLNIKYPDLNKN